MTLQERMRATLERAGIPARQIDVYGSQIMVTCQGRETAQRWASLLAQFATRVRTVESLDYVKKNRGTVLRPTTLRVWRIGATI